MPKLLRITRYRYNDIPYDANGKYYYIKDGDTVWNPGWKPTQTDLDSYACHHGIGYSRFCSSKNGIAADLLAFVPMDATCEVNRLTLTNQTDAPKSLELFSYVEFCLWNAMDDMTNFQRNLSIGEVEVDGSTIYHKTEYRERRNHYSYFSVNTPGRQLRHKPRLLYRRLPRGLQSGGCREWLLQQFHRKRLVTDRRAPDQSHACAGRIPQPDLCARLR